MAQAIIHDIETDDCVTRNRQRRRRRRATHHGQRLSFINLSPESILLLLVLASNHRRGGVSMATVAPSFPPAPSSGPLGTLVPTVESTLEDTLGSTFFETAIDTELMEELTPSPTIRPPPPTKILPPLNALPVPPSNAPPPPTDFPSRRPSYEPTLDSTLESTLMVSTLEPTGELTETPTEEAGDRQDADGLEVPVGDDELPTMEPTEFQFTGDEPDSVNSITFSPTLMDTMTIPPTFDNTFVATPSPTGKPTLYPKTALPTSDPANPVTLAPTALDTNNRQDTPGPAGGVPIQTTTPTIISSNSTNSTTEEPSTITPTTSTSPPTGGQPVDPPTDAPTSTQTNPIPVPIETPNPTRNPSSRPTPRPTTGPPSPSPSRRPLTVQPTTSPPTNAGTPSPSPPPSAGPTTSSPTSGPTETPTKGPTSEPSVQPSPEPTSSPSAYPTMQPVVGPTPLPTPFPSTPPTPSPTGSPSLEPSSAPSASTPEPTSQTPSASPSLLPSSTPTVSPAPTTKTPRPTVSSLPSFDPSVSPTNLPSVSPTDLPSWSPSISPSRLPSNPPSQAPSLSLQNEGDRVVMTLKYADVFEGLSIITWEQITATHIRQSIVSAGVDPPMDDLRVWTNIIRQAPEVNVDSATPAATALQAEPGNRLLRRRAQEAATAAEEPAPLKIAFDTAVSFRSEKTDHDIQALIAGAFNTEEDREEYVNSLKRTNDGAFQNLNEVASVSVGGVIIPEEETNTDKSGQEVETRDMTVFIIIGAVAGGGALLLLIIFFLWRHYMSKQPSSLGKSDPVTGNTESNANGVTTEIVVEHNPDDVSTLGDPVYTPMMGMMTNTMERDERTASVADDYDYKYLKHHNFGTNEAPRDRMMSEGDRSRMLSEETRSRLHSEESMTRESSNKTGSQSKLGFSQMGESLFSDDASFEEQYIESEQQVPFEITVPAGKLGMVIDTPNGGFPIVHAIKDTSILADRVVVGDRLVSVDGQDCTTMTAVQVSKLISLKSDQESRVLVFVRNRAPRPGTPDQ